ncbi:MAG TPA: hypothetical protein VHW24_10785 [Bryobacteraceae bacterium]|nr:hypothetical protein [Bryobacteraceae bacterium]
MYRLSVPLILAASAFASGTTAWEMSSYADFIKGKFDGISLSRDGRVTLGPKMDPVFVSDQPVVWAVAEGPDGSLYAATGNRGRIYKVDRAGKATLLWTAPEPEVFAIAAGKNGVIYAGTSPDGKVYRIENGTASEYFAPQSRYIWSLAVAKDGVLYVGTGDQGKVFRVDGAGKGELYYETGQSHITGLAVDAQGRVLAGTEPNGILYRISAKNQAFVLYDSNLPEIRAIVPMPDGAVYTAALGGSVAKQAQAAAQATQNNVVTAPGTTITVSVDAAANAAEIKPQDVKPPQAIQATPTPQVSSTFSTGPDTNVEKSAVYRINPDNTVETLWTSKEENVYDVLALEKQILFSTDQDGRIYGLSPDRRVTLVAQTNESETLRLLPADHSILAATGNMGRIFRLGEKAGSSGTYEAPVHDSSTASKWGSLSWRADLPDGSKLAFRTRSGNSARPDRTWSEWSQPLTDANGSRITSPNSRFIQWKLEMTAANGATPILNSVSLAYLPQNSPPVLHSVNVVSQAVAAHAAGAQTSSNAAYSVTVSDTGDASPNSTGTSTQTLQRAFNQQITISWQADDPDGDRLLYNVYFRGADEMQWKVLKTATHDTSLSFDADVLADGKYYFRVMASDREVNPPSTARDAILDSAPVMIDNTPPLLKIDASRYANGAAHVEWEAADAASGLRRCEYSLDAGDWIPVEAADGVIDSLREKFALDLTNLKPGEHLVAFRVADAAGNTGVAKVVLK